MSALAPPKEPITFVPARAGEIIRIGHQLTGRVMEDGSNTDNRLGMIELTLAPRASGPVPHWHEMHDETFLITKGTVRFHGAGVKDFEGKSVVAQGPEDGDGVGKDDGVYVDAKEGDYIVIGTRAPHTFSNPTREEAAFVNTLTPAFYVNYFKMMAEMMQVRHIPAFSNISSYLSFSLLLSLFSSLLPLFQLPLRMCEKLTDSSFLPGRTTDPRNQHAGNGLLRHYSGREAPIGIVETSICTGKKKSDPKVALRIFFKYERSHLTWFGFVFSLLTRTCTC